MENKNLTQCPDCGHIQKEPIFINGSYHIIAHYCKDAEFVSSRKIEDIKSLKNIDELVEELPEIELLRKQLIILNETKNIQNRILKNLLFFFWITLIALIIAFIGGFSGVFFS